MGKKKRNPFNPARPAVETFVGRETLLRQLVAGLQDGNSYAITGSPGIGNTSLLLEVERRMLKASDRRGKSPLLLPVYVECQRGADRLEAFLVCIANRMADALGTQYRLICPHQVRAEAQGFAAGRRLDTALATISKWAFEQKQRDYRIILLLDALHHAAGSRWLSSLATILNNLVDRHDLAVLLAGRGALTAELRNDVSPLRHLLTSHFELGPLDQAETQALLDLASKVGWNVDPACASQAYQLTEGHPYRLQYCLHAALSEHEQITEQSLLAVHNPHTLERLNELLADPQTEPARDPGTIFVSYSHEDERDKTQLMKYLDALGAKAWSDDLINAGADWRVKIFQAIDDAKVAVLLVTVDFLGSKFILEEELPRIMERRNQGMLEVVPVIARHCPWEQHPELPGMQLRPKKGLPVWRDDGKHANEELTKIVNEIAAMLGVARS